jgi:hypothetical protein
MFRRKTQPPEPAAVAGNGAAGKPAAESNHRS